MRLWRDRLVRNTFLATALAVAVILWAKQELGLETDVLLGYLAGSALLVLAVIVPAALCVWVVKWFRR